MHHLDNPDRARDIDTARLALDGALVDAINALTRARTALATLISDHVYDVDFVDTADGADTASFLTDSLRNCRAAYRIAHALIEDAPTDDDCDDHTDH